jgi:2-keto-3-deoxy-L-rhamnonate aldolase RhmA
MTVNPLKKIWDAGGVAVGTYIMYSRDIATVEIAAASGLDFLVIDLEHRPHGSESIHDLAQVARLAGLAPLVGPKDISQHAISHALDLGASGVVIPHLETPEEVALAIKAVRYPPRGRRGRCGVAGHNLYSPRSIGEEITHYNSDVALLLKVESETAIRRLDELVAPGEVDGVMIGPTDLSLDLGLPGQTNHPRLVALVDHVRAVCSAKKIHYGAYVHSPEEVPDAIRAGATWVVVGSEIDFLAASWVKAAQHRKGSPH